MGKYSIFSNWPMCLSMGAVLLANFIVAIIIGLTRESSEIMGGNIDISMVGMSIAFGAVICATGFKFALVNGVSRKTYFIASAVSLLIVAVVMAVLAYLSMLVTYNVGQTTDAYYFLYCMTTGATNWGGMFFFELGFMVFGVTLGYFAAMVIYRTRKRGKILILLITMVIGAIFTLLGFFTDIWIYIGKGMLYMLGMGASTPNPFIGMASLLGLGAVLLAATFLLIRRADLRG